jgi:hypothetical protein
MMNMLIMLITQNLTEYKNGKIRNIPSGRTHAQGIGGSIRTSRHSVLLDVADHDQYKTMFTVQSLERPQEEDGVIDRIGSEQLRKTLSKDLIARHTPSRFADAGVVLEVCSSNPPCTQRIGTGKHGSNSTVRKGCSILYLIRAAEASTPFL